MGSSSPDGLDGCALTANPATTCANAPPSTLPNRDPECYK